MIPDGCKGVGLKVWMCQDLLQSSCLHLTAPHKAGTLERAHHSKLVIKCTLTCVMAPAYASSRKQVYENS